jgi:hypothetical protein
MRLHQAQLAKQFYLGIELNEENKIQSYHKTVGPSILGCLEVAKKNFRAKVCPKHLSKEHKRSKFQFLNHLGHEKPSRVCLDS